MKPEITALYRKEGIPEPKILPFIEAMKADIVQRKHLVTLEVAHKKKLIESGGVCARCSRNTMLTTDHIIPKAILEVMGVDTERTFIPENLMLLCRPCNSIKSDRLDFSFPQTKRMLLKLLERL